MNSEPLVYQYEIDIHFSFLDHYNHVNAKHYLDLVASSRLIYLEREMKMPLSKLMELGVGFYLKTAIQNFKRPIVGLQRVLIRSKVMAIRDAYLDVSFEIVDLASGKIYADGTLEYVVMNLKTHRPSPPPLEIVHLFFGKAST